MKRMLTLLLVILIVSTAFPIVSQENMQAFETMSFKYMLPESWNTSEDETGKLAIHYSTYGTIVVNEVDYTDQKIDITNKDALESLFLLPYFALVLQNKSSQETPVDFVVGSYPAKLYNLYMVTEDNEVEATLLLIYANGYMFVSLMTFSQQNFKEINEHAKKFASNVSFKVDLVEQKSDAQKPTNTPDPRKNYKTIEYKKVARDPDTYKGTKAKLNGKVVQVMGDRKNGFELRVATKDDYDDIFYIITSGNHALNILENDIIDFYCTLGGDVTYKTVLGGSITLPLAFADFYDLIE